MLTVALLQMLANYKYQLGLRGQNGPASGGGG